LLKALRLNPNKDDVRVILDRIQSAYGKQTLDPQLPQLMLDFYPSRAPRKLVQVRYDANGRPVPDGIEVEFYANGRIKRFLDIDDGVPNGLELTWDRDGEVLSRVTYRNGRVVDEG
jgi:antitoxin component YwqK of YwqJK toxin-antitoxin module